MTNPATQRVAACEYPWHAWLRDELPKGPTGRIFEREIDVPAELSTA